ncbi:1-phosphatidylinositol 3-phosphate 5-kinase fab1 isoform X2 [Tachypleus tridentatus]|uniref:1-phosphatidylinositol 3-phosphate 5-kinase fab1 isoform X2 n=1 Tax=Tachypleus tridentatus TaxID=6853 RepID=UPI003FD6558A
MQNSEKQNHRLLAKKLESPTSLTEFAPLSSDEKPQSISSLISSLFRRSKNQQNLTLQVPEIKKEENDRSSSDIFSSPEDEETRKTSIQEPWASGHKIIYTGFLSHSVSNDSLNGCTLKSRDWSETHSDGSTVDTQEGQVQEWDVHYTRSVTNVLRRIVNIIDRKNLSTQSYKDSDLKQYWMPDSNCKECYECGDKFTTFRRRHHCRICGQIFCSRCCNQEIPGKIVGVAGDLRVCMYCCKVVYSYMKSLGSDAELSGDMRYALEDLKKKLNFLPGHSSSGSLPELGMWGPPRRKNSVGFREEEIAKAKSSSRTDISEFSSTPDLTALSPQKQTFSPDHIALQELWAQIQHPLNGLDFHNHRHRLRNYPTCIVGTELIEWLLSQNKAKTRSQAVSIGQALVDARFLECIVSQDQNFIDGYSLYRPGEASTLDSSVLPVIGPSLPTNQEGSEPLWVKEIQQADRSSPYANTDDTPELIEVDPGNFSSSHTNDKDVRLSLSSSTFYLNMDIEGEKVTASRPRIPVAEVNQSESENVVSSTREIPSCDVEVVDDSHRGFSGSPIRDNFLKGALLMNKKEGQNVEEISIPRGWHNSQQLREDNGEKLAFERLNCSYSSHEQALLRQLLSSEGLSLQWVDILSSIIHKVIETVRPDVKHDGDEMDIRQYVQIKKIPGGTKAECSIVNGVVCTKNVVHKMMRLNILNPTIMLLSSSIVYQRVENKLSSLDPIIMQEHEYLKNIVAKLSVYKPDVLLVEKTVSRLAQEMLLDAGITLVINVKPTVMDRVARCTQASIISSVDAQLGKPHLGICHHFNIQTFMLCKGRTKTLMFFDGCAANLGCTILLRGASCAELKKVKQITRFMVYVAYNWRLERSFLMDEFAMPPPQPDELPVIVESNEHGMLNESIQPPEYEDKSPNNFEDDLDVSRTTTPVSHEPKLPHRPTTLFFKNSSTTDHENSKSRNNSEEGTSKREPKYIEDCSDPLRLYQQSEDDSIFHHSGSILQEASLPFTNHFRKALDDVILCCSPNIRVNLPYLETESGRNCELRQFFPEEIYWSAQFHREEGTGRKINTQEFDDFSIHSLSIVNHDSVELLPYHPFVFQKLTCDIQESLSLQSMLADFRARGGRYRLLCPHDKVSREQDRKSLKEDSSINLVNLKNCEIPPQTETYWEGKVDALHPYNHQRLVVLFCSYSPASYNAPLYCVSPWVVNMDFYGRNDIPIGGFLERYCFRSTYACPSQTCDKPMTEHVRKFTHENGCVQILLHRLETPIPAAQNNILMWSWCHKCGLLTPLVPLSQDTWSLSFAKYLELRFHGNQYGVRTVSECSHSKHHDHHQYFAHKHVVASFKYTPIVMRELVLPSSVIKIEQQVVASIKHATIEEIKHLAISGYSVYSTIVERLCSLKADFQGTRFEKSINEMMTSQQNERTKFREKIEEVQLRLTSPSLEDIDVSQGNERNNKDTCRIAWRIVDTVVQLKYQIAEAVQNWNSKIQDFMTTTKKEDRSSKGASVAQKPAPGYQQLPVSPGFDVSHDTYLTEVLLSSGSQKFLNLELPKTLAQTTVENLSIPEDDPSKNLQEMVITSSTEIIESDSSLLQPSFLSGSNKDLNQSISSESYYSQTSSFSELGLSSTEQKAPVPSLELLKQNLTDSEGKFPSTAVFRGESGIPILHRVNSEPVNVGRGPESLLVNNKQDNISKGFQASFSSIYTNSLSVRREDVGESVECHESSCDTTDSQQYEDNLKSSPVRGHERSKSDGTEKFTDSVVTKSSTKNGDEDSGSLRPEKKERTVKTILSQWLSSPGAALIQSPFPPSEHYLTTCSGKIPIIVYDQDVGSIIAFTLSSHEYEKQLQEVKMNISVGNTSRDSHPSSPTLRKHQQNKDSEGSSASLDQTVTVADTSPVDFSDITLCNSQEVEKSSGKVGSKGPNPHIEVQFSDATTRFYCRVYFAEQFRKLRRLIFPDGEECYVRSLARCVQWVARGGKSGSSFSKTHDDRFVLKQMSRFEVQSFLDFAPRYFQYITKACSEQKPTVLAKIVGAYKIVYKNSSTNTAAKLDLLVMENLFYGRTVSQKFDLKGSVRNRMVNTTSQQEEDLVLLDENLLKMLCDNPFNIRPHSKTVLTLAIDNDAHFLASHSVMDYSLLVGLDDEKKEMVVGIIDYIRTFTWDKKIEMVVKSTGILGGHGKLPTVVSPELYRMRFCEAMDGYFLWVPDRWSGLGRGVDC